MVAAGEMVKDGFREVIFVPSGTVINTIPDEKNGEQSSVSEGLSDFLNMNVVRLL